MRIPPNNDERENFYLDLIEKCMVSREERVADYGTLRSYYLFGAGPEEPPAYFNKIHPHLDQLTSFLYSAESTRFSVNVGAAVADDEHRKVPKLTMALNDEWLNSNADQVFSTALTWSLVYNTTFVKLVYKKGINPYMIEPGAMGVLREDTPYVHRQEAICQRYYITRSELYSQLYTHPKREKIVERVTGNIKNTSNDGADGGDGVARIVMSATNPTIYGQVNMDLYGMNKYRARVAEETIEMTELWIWNDEIDDYQCVTIASPNVIIYDRPGESLFLKGEHPFVQICPNPQYDYFWGQSEAQKLMLLQSLRNNRMTEILDLLSKQVSPPTSLTGFTGILDEKNFALNRAGGLLASDMPNAKAERMGPEMPSNLWEVTHEIDTMFSEVSGISNVLSGRGESGVRSQGHASQLARLGSSRAKKRALIVEDSLEKVATLYLKLMQVYDPTHFKDTEGTPFIAEQFTRDFVVKVDAHSNSPIFTEDTKELAFSLFKAQAIDKESLLDMLEPPMKQLLKDKLKRRMEKEASQPKPEPDAKKEK